MRTRLRGTQPTTLATPQRTRAFHSKDIRRSGPCDGGSYQGFGRHAGAVTAVRGMDGSKAIDRAGESCEEWGVNLIRCF